MKQLSSIDGPLKPLVVNEVIYAIDSNYVDAQLMQPDSSLYNQCRTPRNSQPVPKTSVFMPGNVQIYRQVLLSDTKISKETKIELYNLLQKYNVIILKNDNDIGWTDLIKIHMPRKPNATPIAAWP